MSASRLPRSTALALAALLPAIASFAAQTGPRTSSLTLHGSRAGARVDVVQDENQTSLDVPASARLERLVAARNGWILTALEGGLDARTEVLVWTLEVDGIARRLPSPTLAAGAEEVRDPIPLVDRTGTLEALVWLEGGDPQGLVIRHAEWSGAVWHEPATVVERAPGSQLALDAATLTDGTHLLVWSRYDGADDEIFWATIADGQLAAPRRAHADNDVPDITPAVVATPSGPLLAWSRFDGYDYRLQLARLEGEEWRAYHTLPGRGAFLPRWQIADSGELFLTYRNGERQAWSTARLDDVGTVRQLAHTAGPADATPRLAVVGDREVLVLEGGRALTLDWQPAPSLP
jgi:hypothetical protein